MCVAGEGGGGVEEQVEANEAEGQRTSFLTSRCPYLTLTMAKTLYCLFQQKLSCSSLADKKQLTN